MDSAAVGAAPSISQCTSAIPLALLQHPALGSNYSVSARGHLHSDFTVTGTSPAYPLLVFLISWEIVSCSLPLPHLQAVIRLSSKTAAD